MFGATSVWIVPHVSVELVNTVPVHRIEPTRCYYWNFDDNEMFATCLGRITAGVLDSDDNIISKVLDEIWERNQAAIFPIAVAHGYGKALEYISRADHAMVRLVLKNQEIYEKHWDFYVVVGKIIKRYDYDHILYSKAAMRGFSRLDEIKPCEALVSAAIESYKHGDTQLYDIIAKCIQDPGISIGIDGLEMLIYFDDFDDLIMSGNTPECYKPVAHIYALQMGKDKLAEYIMSQFPV